MIMSETSISSQLQNNYFISRDDIPGSLSGFSTFTGSKQLIDPLFSTKDYIICHKIKSCSDIQSNNHTAYSKYSIVVSNCLLSLMDTEK